MPDTLNALLLFSVFIVPGFLLQRGYLRARAHGVAQADLHALAAAIVWSLVVLAVAWWCGGQSVLGWLEAGTVNQHLKQTYGLALGLLLAPYPIGLVAGVISTALAQKMEVIREERAEPGTKWARCLWVLDSFGFFGAPTVWDGVWGQFWTRRIYVRVRTKTGQDIVGAFEKGSWVGLSPEPAQLFLSTVYREEPAGSHNWKPVPRTIGSIHRCHGDRINRVRRLGHPRAFRSIGARRQELAREHRLRVSRGRRGLSRHRINRRQDSVGARVQNGYRLAPTSADSTLLDRVSC